MLNHAYKLDLQPSPHDPRDLRLEVVPQLAEPKLIDMTTQISEVFDQLTYSACAPNSWGQVIVHTRKVACKFKGKFSRPARMLIYNQTLKNNGSTTDEGSNMRDGGDVLVDFGIVAESLFPYTEANMFKAVPPSVAAQAALYRRWRYYACDTVPEMRSTLQQGFLFTMGFPVPAAFMDDTMATTGRMSMKDWNTTVDGNHAVVCIGYDDVNQEWICLNSWGVEFGKRGTFRIPYEKMDRSFFDHYTLRIVNG